MHGLRSASWPTHGPRGRPGWSPPWCPRRWHPAGPHPHRGSFTGGPGRGGGSSPPASLMQRSPAADAATQPGRQRSWRPRACPRGSCGQVPALPQRHAMYRSEPGIAVDDSHRRCLPNDFSGPANGRRFRFEHVVGVRSTDPGDSRAGSPGITTGKRPPTVRAWKAYRRAFAGFCPLQMGNRRDRMGDRCRWHCPLICLASMTRRQQLHQPER